MRTADCADIFDSVFLGKHTMPQKQLSRNKKQGIGRWKLVSKIRIYFRNYLLQKTDRDQNLDENCYNIRPNHLQGKMLFLGKIFNFMLQSTTALDEVCKNLEVFKRIGIVFSALQVF